MTEVNRNRRRHEQPLQRAHDALTELARTGEPVTVVGLASRAGVSRSWIYTQPELRERIRRLQLDSADPGILTQRVASAGEEWLRRRLTLAHEQVSQLRAENQRLRGSLSSPAVRRSCPHCGRTITIVALVSAPTAPSPAD